MLYWDPKSTEFIEWEPSMGWNASLTEQEKIMLMNLFFFFKNKKRLANNIAESLALMYIFKGKYPELKYSNEQEQMLQYNMQTVHS